MRLGSDAECDLSAVRSVLTETLSLVLHWLRMDLYHESAMLNARVGERKHDVIESIFRMEKAPTVRFASRLTLTMARFGASFLQLQLASSCSKDHRVETNVDAIFRPNVSISAAHLECPCRHLILFLSFAKPRATRVSPEWRIL